MTDCMNPLWQWMNAIPTVGLGHGHCLAVLQRAMKVGGAGEINVLKQHLRRRWKFARAGWIAFPIRGPYENGHYLAGCLLF